MNYSLFSLIHFIILFRMNCKPVIGKEEFQRIQSKRDIGPFKIQKILRLDVEQYQSKGQWDIKQNAYYAAFIKLNSSNLQGKPYNKLWKQFKKMAKFIGTRNFLQCKSHHHKLYNEFYDTPTILTHFFTIYPYFSEYLEQAEIELEEQASPLRLKKVINKQKKLPKPIIPLPVKPFYIPTQNLKTGQNYQDAKQQWINAMEAMHNSANIMFNFPTHKNPFLSETSLGYGKYSFNQEMQVEWIECHRLFLAWLNKVNALISSGS